MSLSLSKENEECLLSASSEDEVVTCLEKNEPSDRWKRREYDREIRGRTGYIFDCFSEANERKEVEACTDYMTDNECDMYEFLDRYIDIATEEATEEKIEKVSENLLNRLEKESFASFGGAGGGETLLPRIEKAESYLREGQKHSGVNEVVGIDLVVNMAHSGGLALPSLFGIRGETGHHQIDIEKILNSLRRGDEEKAENIVAGRLGDCYRNTGA